MKDRVVTVVGVDVGAGVRVGAGVVVSVGVAVSVGVGVSVSVTLAVAVGLAVTVELGVEVMVTLAVGVGDGRLVLPTAFRLRPDCEAPHQLAVDLGAAIIEQLPLLDPATR